MANEQGGPLRFGIARTHMVRTGVVGKEAMVTQVCNTDCVSTRLGGCRVMPAFFTGCMGLGGVNT